MAKNNKKIVVKAAKISEVDSLLKSGFNSAHNTASASSKSLKEYYDYAKLHKWGFVKFKDIETALTHKHTQDAQPCYVISLSCSGLQTNSYQYKLETLEQKLQEATNTLDSVSNWMIRLYNETDTELYKQVSNILRSLETLKIEQQLILTSINRLIEEDTQFNLGLVAEIELVIDLDLNNQRGLEAIHNEYIYTDENGKEQIRYRWDYYNKLHDLKVIEENDRSTLWTIEADLKEIKSKKLTELKTKNKELYTKIVAYELSHTINRQEDSKSKPKNKDKPDSKQPKPLKPEITIEIEEPEPELPTEYDDEKFTQNGNWIEYDGIERYGIKEVNGGAHIHFVKVGDKWRSKGFVAAEKIPEAFMTKIKEAGENKEEDSSEESYHTEIDRYGRTVKVRNQTGEEK